MARYPLAITLALPLLMVSARPVLADEPEPPADQASPVAARAEPVAIIDLREGDTIERRDSRRALADGLALVNGIELVADSELLPALVGERAERATADQALTRAQQAYGAVDCTTTLAAAREAVLGYAALADDSTGRAPLERAYVYWLLCSNNQGDIDTAQRVASRLRQLTSDSPPTGISPAVWARYPAVDAASNVMMGQLTITGKATASIWVDHQPVGSPPVTISLNQGEHLVAATSARGITSRFVDLGDQSTIDLEIPPGGSRWAKVRARIASWRQGDDTADAAALGELLRTIGLRFVLVLAGTEQVEVWALPAGAKAARRLGTKSLKNSFELAAIVVETVESWEGPDLTTLVTDRDPEYAKPPKKPQKWWVYAGILGAVAVGTSIMLLSDLADDRQRIELTWP